MIELAPLAPFGARFNTKNVATTKNAGPAVPTMDLELRGIGNSSRNTYWRIYGANWMASQEKCNVLGILWWRSKPSNLDSFRRVSAGGPLLSVWSCIFLYIWPLALRSCSVTQNIGASQRVFWRSLSLAFLFWFLICFSFLLQIKICESVFDNEWIKYASFFPFSSSRSILH